MSAPSSLIPFGLGLCGTLVLFGLGLGLALQAPSPPPEPAPEPGEAAGPAGPLTYMPLPEPILASVRDNRRQLTLRVVFAVDGTGLDLPAMAGKLRADIPLLVAELAEAVRLCDETQPTIEAFRRALPAALREVVNARYGTEAAPAPVYEALLTEFIVR
ncbi:hypothetical protein [Rhodobacter sp. CZR27]|uniref:hypothetical protein n=1 Tax=Rhodobacter sp. CZR27 TaxID=2033869 RepID=UPI000BBE8EE2|nr:hypothetical protein [Rhodobacter sp. CZR27]